MRIRFYSTDMSQYVTIRPEEFKLCVKRTKSPKVRKRMPLPNRVTQTSLTSNVIMSKLSQEEKALLLESLVADSEESLTAMGKKAIVSLKLGYRNGYQVSIGEGKDWSNVTRPTLLEAIQAYLKGEFD